MAVITLPWVDAFELSTTAAINARYDSGSVASIGSYGRTNQGISLGSGLIQTRFANETTVIVGIAQYLTNYSEVDFIKVLDSAGALQFKVRQKGNGTLALYRGTTLLATSDATTQVILTGYWVYIELKVTINSMTGSYELRVNNTTWLSASNVNTQDTGNANAAYVQINGIATNGGTPTGTYYDDYYVAGGSLSSPLNTFWGNQKMEMLRPNAAGTYSQHSRGGTDYGSNFREVQDLAQDGDTTYVTAGTVGYKDSYNLYDMAGQPSDIKVVRGMMYSRKEDIADRENAFLLIRSGSEEVGPAIVLSASYSPYYRHWPNDPYTGLPWSYGAVAGIEMGSKVIV